jgi:hypothetical protein
MEDNMTDTQPTTPSDSLDDLMSPVMPAALDGLELTLKALPAGSYRSVSVSVAGPHGTATLTFSVGEPEADE